jgi:hypothetical protein
MGIFSKANPGKLVADAVVETANGVANIVERWAPSDQAKHQMNMDVTKLVTDSIAAARAYDPRTTGTGKFSEIVNVSVDAVARMIRPGVTILIIGGVFGWWPLETENVNPVVLSWGEIVVGFWFGYRTVIKDVPALLASLKQLRSKS